MGAFVWDAFLGPMFHKHKSSSILPGVPSKNGITANGLIASIPSGHILEKMFITETGNNAIIIDLGYTVGGKEIDTNLAVGALGEVFPSWDFYRSNTLPAFNVYISKVGGGVWGGTSLNIDFVTRKIR